MFRNPGVGRKSEMNLIITMIKYETKLIISFTFYIKIFTLTHILIFDKRVSDAEEILLPKF